MASTCPSAATSSRLEELVRWAQEKGAWLHPSVEVYSDEQTGLSVRVRHNVASLEPGFKVVTCPKTLGLSYLNALVEGPMHDRPLTTSPAFPPDFMTNNSPHVIGRFFLIRQYLDGKKSPWWPYVQSLPQPDDASAWNFPPFWPDEDVAYLAGTNALAAIREIRANLKGEFETAKEQLEANGYPGWQDFTETLYHWAYSIFSSRGFRPSLILPTSFQQTVSQLLSSGVQLDDFSILQPLLDLANHSPAAKVSWDVGETGCTLVSGHAAMPGSQIFNNYGPKTNAELLLSYGFTITATETLHNDYLHFQKKVRRGDGKPGEEFALGAKGKPLEFLVSLRPMDHASSGTGRKRQFLRTGEDKNSLPLLRVFSHMEDFFVLDFALTLMDDSEQQVLLQHGQSLQKRHQADVTAPVGLELQFWLLGALLSDPPDSRLVPVLRKIQEALGYKLQRDLEHLHQAGEDLNKDAGRCSQNQLLALQYRKRVEKVIRAALLSLEEDRQLIPVNWGDDAGSGP